MQSLSYALTFDTFLQSSFVLWSFFFSIEQNLLLMKQILQSSLYLLSACALLCTTSCKKDNGLGVDNDQVIQTPYSFYAANSEGWLIHTNDGVKFDAVFPPDGYPTSQITTSNNNLLVIKENLHMSANNGQNFNPVWMSVNKFPWQPMLYSSVSQNNIFVASSTGKGIAISQDNGKTFVDDTNWEPNAPPVSAISSFAELANGTVFAFTNVTTLIFRKDNRDASWRAVTANSSIGLLPIDGTSYYINASDNTLFLTDYNGMGGVWQSVDEGTSWTRIGQGTLPIGKKWRCSSSPSGGTSFLVGTDSAGVYRVENGSFVSANIGLENNIRIYGMSTKRNIYKNGNKRSFVFIATSKGIYRSEDQGRTWKKVSTGEFDGDYRAAF
jgi:hypothetical protein